MLESNSPYRTIFELILQQDRRWNVELITSCFDLEIAMRILCIPLGSQVQEDAVV